MKKANLTIFSIGAVGYGLIEILWRGRTHWSMLLAGGTAFWGLSKISQKMKFCSLLAKAIAGSALITTIEFVYGIVFNIILKKNVWDYSRMPLNFCGQICALYSLFWVVLSFIFIPFADRLQKHFER
ncbi:MAG: hypothetical protein Q4B40_02810 [Clostridia bacterium]|nr:hypothetical protein [Clostridia bacterium]